jgi:NAD(P)H-binding
MLVALFPSVRLQISACIEKKSSESKMSRDFEDRNKKMFVKAPTLTFLPRERITDPSWQQQKRVNMSRAKFDEILSKNKLKSSNHKKIPAEDRRMSSSTTATTTSTTTLVIGATGATGKHVVQTLLNRGQNVRVIVRSKERMQSLLKCGDDVGNRLDITEASFSSLTDQQVRDHVQGCQAVVSCLGHNMTLRGIWGKPRRLVTDAVRRLTSAIRQTTNGNTATKFILMGSDGVSHPDGITDDKRLLGERTVLSLLRCLVPPHSDNEEAAAYLYRTVGTTTGVEWSVVRPTDLINGDVSAYQLYDKPPGSLFGGGVVTRANVATFMVELILDPNIWNEYKHKMPIIHNKVAPTTKSEKQI